MTLVANSIPFHAAGFKAANREQRVPAGGFPAHHSLTGYPVMISCDSRYLKGTGALDKSGFKSLSMR